MLIPCFSTQLRLGFQIPRYFELETVSLGFALHLIYYRLFETPAISTYFSLLLGVRNSGFALYNPPWYK